MLNKEEEEKIMKNSGDTERDCLEKFVEYLTNNDINHFYRFIPTHSDIAIPFDGYIYQYKFDKIDGRTVESISGRFLVELKIRRNEMKNFNSLFLQPDKLESLKIQQNIANQDLIQNKFKILYLNVIENDTTIGYFDFDEEVIEKYRYFQKMKRINGNEKFGYKKQEIYDLPKSLGREINFVYKIK